MQIQLTWKEHGNNFAGVYEFSSMEAQHDFLVLRTSAGTVTVPYKCMTGAIVGTNDAMTIFNQEAFADEITDLLTEDKKFPELPSTQIEDLEPTYPDTDTKPDKTPAEAQETNGTQTQGGSDPAPSGEGGQGAGGSDPNT